MEDEYEDRDIGIYPEYIRLVQMVREQERVETLLRRYTSSRDAEWIAKQLFEWAIEMDEVVRFLKDETQLLLKFTHDGKAFASKPNEQSSWHACYDGLNFLKILGESNTRACFREDPQDGKHFMLEWLEYNYVYITKVRKKLWEETGSISLVTKEQLAEARRIAEAKEEHVDIPSYLFEQYEEQMKYIN